MISSDISNVRAYTPIFFGSSVSNKLRSISGQSNYVDNTAASEISLAKANGADIWYTEVVADRFLICDLLTMMGKSTNHQWFSNWYLQELDHFIKEELHAIYYVRYMDDMVIFGSNKKVLHRMRLRIDSYLRSNLGLRLKDNWQVCPTKSTTP